MTRHARTVRCFSLLEIMTVVSLLGAFLLVSGPFTKHMICALYDRPRAYDQLFQVSRISDRIRAELIDAEGPDRPVVTAVEERRLVIASGGQTIEYRTEGQEIRRIASAAGGTANDVLWRIPLGSLSFTREDGRERMLLIGLRWSLRSSTGRREPAATREIFMNIAAERPDTSRSAEE